MSGRIGKYTYKNNGVLREFLSAISRALGQRSSKKVIDKFKNDPEGNAFPVKAQQLWCRKNWKNEIMETNSKAMYLKEVDREISSADIIDQASSQAEKTVEMRTLNRQMKLLSKINKAIKRIDDNTYGYCEETGEPIGLKRLIARPIATLSIEAQEKHEKNEKIFADM